MTTDRFAHTREALRIFDATASEREAAWQACATDAHVWACQQRDESALAAVRAAFFEDTQDCNSRDHKASLEFMRRMAALPRGEHGNN